MENKHLKPLVRARDGNKCCFCKRDVFEVKEEGKYTGNSCVHHIIPTEFGGENTPENCVTICIECHQLLETLIRKYKKGVRTSTLKELYHIIAQDSSIKELADVISVIEKMENK